jgi:hypothetical protein
MIRSHLLPKVKEKRDTKEITKKPMIKDLETNTSMNGKQIKLKINERKLDEKHLLKRIDQRGNNGNRLF